MKEAKYTEPKMGEAFEERYFEAAKNQISGTWTIYRHHKSSKNGQWYKKEYLNEVEDQIIDNILEHCDKNGI